MLHGPLVQGYALDALDVVAPAAADASSLAPAEAFLEQVLNARVSEHDGIGLGRDVRFAGSGVAGAGLVAGDELVQLTAFPDDAVEDATGEQTRCGSGARRGGG